jgi:hypothetical protein
MLRYLRQYNKRFTYEDNKTETWKLPRNNLFSAINLLLTVEVNIVTSTSSNAPDFQVWNAIERIELIQDAKKAVWSISGQAAGLLFRRTFGTGILAADTAAIAGTVATNVIGKEFARLPANPLDAIKPWDYAIDTRAHDYELKIKWRNVAVAGTLFGTVGGTITKTDSEIYVDVELENLKPQPNPVDGSADALMNQVPLIVGLREDKQEVSTSNNKFQIDLPSNQKYRNIILYTTHVAATLQELGENDIIQNDIKLYDTQGTFYHTPKVEMLRQDTSRRWGSGSNMPNGFYDINMTAFGSVFDALVANNITDLFLDLDVVKQANATYIRPIYVTQETQGI